MQPTVSHIECNDYKNIYLDVVLESASPTIQCFSFHIYPEDSVQKDRCDAYVQIETVEINKVRDLYKVSPENYTSFIDENKVIWNIVPPPLPMKDHFPELLWQFNLKRQEQ
jgi:hypothetical protein